MELLTDCVRAEILTAFHHCSLSQRAEPSQAVPPQTWSAPSTDVRHDIKGERVWTLVTQLFKMTHHPPMEDE